MTTQKQVRENFWAYIKEIAPQYLKEYKTNKKQNQYTADVRTLFVDYVDNLQKSGEIKQNLAYKVTL
jgi:tRNA-dihydrouridine synthase